MFGHLMNILMRNRPIDITRDIRRDIRTSDSDSDTKYVYRFEAEHER
jgi:hypothetical protein